MFHDGSEIQDRLAAVRSREGLAVAVSREGACRFGAVGGEHGRFGPDTPIVVGCVAKCLTATLVAQAMDAMGFGADDAISDLLDLRSARSRKAVEGITVGHLLNHTHGLDDAMIGIDAVPRRLGGCIDADALCGELAAAERLAEPGACYSYGGTGSWLLASLLEQEYGATYWRILQDWLFAPCGIGRGLALSATDVCPAWGGRLALSATDLVRFLCPHLSGGGSTTAADERLGVLREGVVGMPGWLPWHKHASYGWNLYGQQWLGHNGNRDGTGIALRFHRSASLGIVVVSGREADCFQTLARLFGDILEEYAREYVDMPTALDSGERTGEDVLKFAGDYVNARWRVRVEAVPGADHLRMGVFDRTTGSDAAALKRHLRPAGDGVYLTVPAGVDYPFVHFVGERHGGHARHLWNGRQLWRSVDGP